jgi:transitional endoplasmic reticulum ATPase
MVGGDRDELRRVFQEMLASMRDMNENTDSEGSETMVQRKPITKADSEAETALEKTRVEVLENLERLGKVTTGDDALIFDGTRFILPSSMRGSIPSAIKYLRDYEESQETSFSFSRLYNYRPWDGADAFQRAMKRVFGTSGIGKPTVTMFGSTPPQYRTVASGYKQSIQVPWGEVAFSPLDAVFELDVSRSADHGLIFALSVTAPKKYRAHIDAFFQVVEDELRSQSIYRGKAFTGGLEPQFLDTSGIDPAKVIYSEDVMVQLETNLWSVLRHGDAMKSAGLDLKRSVLVEGPYGTGKTLAGQLTAKEAVDNGWTFIVCRPGNDDLFETLQTAQLYAPAVVWFEDIDTLAKGSSDSQVSRLLDALDGVQNKGVDVIAGFTTNHVDKIQKGVLRPGRLDAVIHIGELDDEGQAKLVKSVLAENLRGDIDYAEVAVAFRGFLPAFAKEAAVRAVRYAISRGNGVPVPVNTADLVNSANGLRPQLALMADAVEGVKIDPLAAVFERVVAEGLEGAKLLDSEGDVYGSIGLGSKHSK